MKVKEEHGTVYATERGNIVRVSQGFHRYQVVFRANGDGKLMVMGYNDRLEAIEALRSFESTGMTL